MYRSSNRNERGQLNGERLLRQRTIPDRFGAVADHGRKLHRRYREQGLFDSSDYVASEFSVRSWFKCN